jgi:hypothetical protein
MVIKSLNELVKSKAYCLVVQAVDSASEPCIHMRVLGSFSLVRTRDYELAFIWLSDLYRFVNSSKTVDLHRWSSTIGKRALDLGPFVKAIEIFYECWDAKDFWKKLTDFANSRPLAFTHAIISQPTTSFRLLVAVADAMKLRGEKVSALKIYLNLCRSEDTPALRQNIFRLALEVDPSQVPRFLQEFAPENR